MKNKLKWEKMMISMLAVLMFLNTVGFTAHAQSVSSTMTEKDIEIGKILESTVQNIDEEIVEANLESQIEKEVAALIQSSSNQRGDNDYYTYTTEYGTSKYTVTSGYPGG